MAIFCPLASGSKGNCLLLGTERTKILVDAGLSFKQLKERLHAIDIDVASIDAVVITHEHSDHIKGLEVLAKQLNIPVLANSDTAKVICEQFTTPLKFKIFSTGEMFSFGDIDLHPFSIQHDTVDPVAFTAKFAGKKIGICADLGCVTTLVKMHLKDCDALYIESNHEPSMVQACSRPIVYKQRVLGRQGHLSNQSCAELLQELYQKQLKHVYLAHLSEECNNPQVALRWTKNLLEPYLQELSVNIAFQHEVSSAIRW